MGSKPPLHNWMSDMNNQYKNCCTHFIVNNISNLKKYPLFSTDTWAGASSHDKLEHNAPYKVH